MKLQSIVKEIMREYDKMRLQNLSELENRKNILYSKIPRIKEIDNELAKTAISLAKNALLANDTVDSAINELYQKNLDLQGEKVELLYVNGYPENYLEATYSCKICKDTGYLDNVKCKCFKQKLINKLYAQSNLENILQKENFNTFKIQYYSDMPLSEQNSLTPRANMDSIFKVCVQFCDNFDNGAPDLLMLGETGLGKTFLCNCIAKYLLDKGKTVLYQTAPLLFEIIEKQKFSKQSDSDYELLEEKLEYIYSCDLLIIDDLGAEINSIVINTGFFNIINTRMLKNKRTIISTNLTLNEIFQNYSERLASRIMGTYRHLKFYGDDIRLKIR